jgi:hypothetical protein
VGPGAGGILDDEVVSMPATAAHLVHFYASPDGLAETLALFFAEPLKRGESLIAVLRPHHRVALDAALLRAGVDLQAETKAGRYVVVDLDEALAEMVREHGLDLEYFRQGPRELVLEARRRTGSVHVYGEMIGELVSRGDLVTAMELEALWSEFMREHPFRLFCGYPRDVLTGDLAGLLDGVASAHHAVLTVRGGDVPRSLSAAVDLPVGADTTQRARSTLREVLGAWGITDAGWLQTACTVTDELLTAATRRGGAHISLSLTSESESVVVAVTASGDEGGEDPWSESAGHAEAGRSYALLGSRAQAWGSEQVPGGIRVWARLAR